MNALWLWTACFAAGAGLFWSGALFPFARPPSRDSVGEWIARFWRSSEASVDGAPDAAALPNLSSDERAFLERARLAGVQWTYSRYVWGRRGGALAGAYLWLMASVSSGFDGWLAVRAAVGCFAAAGACWFAPNAALAAMAARRRGLVLAELSKFAHRLAVCLVEQNDMRELILRAGRPLRVLKPPLQRLAAQWGNDQREAIAGFRDAVGISEAYPLVNAFGAVSRAKSADVKRLLGEHAKSIDATLESELTKRLENAPIWISFYIMIPFMVCLALFVYPWMVTVLEQLSVSFRA